MAFDVDNTRNNIKFALSEKENKVNKLNYKKRYNFSLTQATREEITRRANENGFHSDSAYLEYLFNSK